MEPAPGHLARDGKRFWAAVVRDYDADGEGWEAFEYELLRLACEALDRCAQARRAIRRHGLVYDSPQGSPVARPEVTIERQARQAFGQFVKQLGLGEALDEIDDEAPKARRGTSYTSTNRRRREGTYAANKAAVVTYDDDEDEIE